MGQEEVQDATPGRVGYESYAAFTGGKTFDGRDMPKWDELPPRIRGAWHVAAAAARTGRTWVDPDTFRMGPVASQDCGQPMVVVSLDGWTHPWAELAQRAVHKTTTLSVALLRGGMQSGEHSLAFAFVLADGSAVFAETSVKALRAVLGAIEGRIALWAENAKRGS